jgi:hypothetical protein
MKITRPKIFSFPIAGLLAGAALAAFSVPSYALTYEDYPVVKLRALDKVTARTMTFEAKVGATVKFGEIFIKVQACRKPPPVEKTEAASFLQIWQTDSVTDESKWVFSGWTFSSSPTLSPVDHPIYDVWVLDCLGRDPEELPPPEIAADEATPPAQDEIEEKGLSSPEEAPPAVVPAGANGIEEDTEARPDTSPATEGKPDTQAEENTAPTPSPEPSPAPIPAPERAPDPVLAPAPEQQKTGSPDPAFEGIY